MKILIIDDEDDIREVARVSLELVGHHTVLTASSGPEGVQQARLAEPDAILLDVVTPPPRSALGAPAPTLEQWPAQAQPPSSPGRPAAATLRRDKSGRRSAPAPALPPLAHCRQRAPALRAAAPPPLPPAPCRQAG